MKAKKEQMETVTAQTETLELSPEEVKIEQLNQEYEKLTADLSERKNAIELLEFEAPEGVVIDSVNDLYKQLKAGLENEESRQQALQIKAIIIEEIASLEPKLEELKEKRRVAGLEHEGSLLRVQMVERGYRLKAILEQIDPILAEMKEITFQVIDIQQRIKPYRQEPGEGTNEFCYFAKLKLYSIDVGERWVHYKEHTPQISHDYSRKQEIDFGDGTKVLGMQSYQPTTNATVQALNGMANNITFNK